jgi:hypothetical protein
MSVLCSIWLQNSPLVNGAIPSGIAFDRSLLGETGLKK